MVYQGNSQSQNFEIAIQPMVYQGNSQSQNFEIALQPMVYQVNSQSQNFEVALQPMVNLRAPVSLDVHLTGLVASCQCY
jgi:hypothetical protein